MIVEKEKRWEAERKKKKKNSAKKQYKKFGGRSEHGKRRQGHDMGIFFVENNIIFYRTDGRGRMSEMLHYPQAQIYNNTSNNNNSNAAVGVCNEKYIKHPIHYSASVASFLEDASNWNSHWIVKWADKIFTSE